MWSNSAKRKSLIAAIFPGSTYLRAEPRLVIVLTGRMAALGLKTFIQEVCDKCTRSGIKRTF